jgi:PRTRC genetic system protein A
LLQKTSLYLFADLVIKQRDYRETKGKIMENTNCLNDFLEEMDNDNPFAAEVNETETKIEIEQTAPKSQEPLLDDDFDAALKASAEKSKERLTGALADKNPIFKYAGTSEPITDKDITFDELRKKYESDFPELEDDKSISWTVTYGKINESISNPTKEKVFAVKAKIEKSDKFIADLKKAKKDTDKNPECVIKPTVSAQKKGDALAAMPSYKGFFMNRDEAIESKKAISFVPARDGRIYEIRQNPIGIFQSPARAIGEFPDLIAKFVMGLPKIPMFLLHQVISFFRAILQKAELEALVHLVYNTNSEKYDVIVPKQKVTKVSVDAELQEYPEHLIHVLDIHSHNVMAAKFSATDDKDEKATRLYGVIGKLNQAIPEISFRASNGGKFIELNAEEIFDYDSTYPEEWFDNLNHAMAEAICESETEKAA